MKKLVLKVSVAVMLLGGLVAIQAFPVEQAKAASTDPGGGRP